MVVPVTVAVNCWVVPRAIVEFTGDTAIEDRAALPRVSVAEPLTEPRVAVMVVCPEPALVASPFVPAELLMVATAAAVELQLTELGVHEALAIAVTLVERAQLPEPGEIRACGTQVGDELAHPGIVGVARR